MAGNTARENRNQRRKIAKRQRVRAYFTAHRVAVPLLRPAVVAAPPPVAQVKPQGGALPAAKSASGAVRKKTGVEPKAATKRQRERAAR